MFKPVAAPVDFPKLEEKILKFWQENKIFEKSLEKTKDGPPFVFYEGPPTANGKPHLGHVLARSFKDLFPRFKTMQGFYVHRKAGWDSHGLPVELEVEKELGITGKKQIEEFGIEQFNKLCRESVFRYIETWERLTERMGFWIDLKEPYVVLDKEYIESLWWILKQAWEKKLLVKDYKVTPYCPRCQTPISSHELAQGYRDDVPDPSIYVKFAIRDSKGLVEERFFDDGLTKAFLLAWTTAPWTLLGNVALAVDPQANYLAVREPNNASEVLILAKERLGVLTDDYEIVGRLKGQDLVGLEYEPLYSLVSYDRKAHYVVPADFVDLSEGTGVVHTAVMYGEEDFELGKKFDLPKKHVVNGEGKFVKEVTPFAGQGVWKATGKIIADLKKKKALYKSETVYHTYPYCWRCKSRLIYYALESWFLKMARLKDRLLKNNAQVNWYPAHIKEGRMGDWLRNVKDWSISRWRYWGTPLPVWRCGGCGHEVCVGSYHELQKLAGGKLNLKNFDPHRPYIDEIRLTCPKCQSVMHRYEDVIDTWFDSGGMPYAQWHYPFENENIFKRQFPADFVCEGIDQTRGWFYTLLAEATLLNVGNPYKNVLSTELVLDEHGQKMSKSVGNVIDPFEVFDEFGADVVRWYFYSSSQIGKPYRMGRRELSEIRRRFFNILWNSYRFFVTKANIAGWAPGDNRESENILDRWLLSGTHRLIKTVTEALEAFDAYTASNAIADFVVKDLSQWYIRRSRDRVGTDFYDTTYQVLLTLCRLLAPLTPFLAEEIYQNLRFADDGPDSVHLGDWPKYDQSCIDDSIQRDMDFVRAVAEKGHAARKEAGLPVRQPLAALKVSNPKFQLPNEFLDLIKDELNVKKVGFVDGEGEIEVGLDTRITPELKAEGEARELVRQIQGRRKKAGCRLDEEIIVTVPDWPRGFEDYIKQKTLAKDLKRGSKLRIERCV